MEIKSVLKIVRDILTDLGKLSDEQLLSLLESKSKFKYFNPEEIKPSPSKKVSVDIALLISIGERLKGYVTIEEAESYLKGQKLTVPTLKQLAKHLEIFVPGKGTKDNIISAIVRSTVGSRLDSAAIQRV